MEGRSTFLHQHGGFKRTFGEGQRPGPTVNPGTAGNCRTERGLVPFKAARPRFLEKTSDTDMPAVPKPTQVGGCKNTQARGRNLVKELGNMTP